ncbi:hypothetical protein CesoFtcFv8_006458 [Champsocephalus esox]|uniref:Uncharacterized protein n=1 Tax=Champsocephalus esox TaxID=159716 RepID=A0AAN8H759_9TELE|nr:hypothetical protein CesoFtcFv8_006458 [Champsocephalus esox]
MRSLGRRVERRRDKGVTAVSSHSVTPGLAGVYRAVSHVGRPLPGDTGHQGEEKIIAPSVRASRDRGLTDTTGN